MKRLSTQAGITYLEMVATAAIMAILASAILPTAKVMNKRAKEIELRRALREMRAAIDLYEQAADPGNPQGVRGCSIAGGDNPPLPRELEDLAKQYTCNGQIQGATQASGGPRPLRFLRRVPVDPMTATTEWGLRCKQDPPDSTSHCGDDIWDVYTTYEGTALDGTKYSDW